MCSGSKTFLLSFLLSLSLSIPSLPPCLREWSNVYRGKSEKRTKGMDGHHVFSRDWHHTSKLEGIFVFCFSFYLSLSHSVSGRKSRDRLNQKQMYGQVWKSTYPYIKPGWNYPLSSDRTGSRLLLYLVHSCRLKPSVQRETACAADHATVS